MMQCMNYIQLYALTFSQSTRSFLFSRFVLQCQACLRSSAIPIDTFTATIKPNTGIDELCGLVSSNLEY